MLLTLGASSIFTFLSTSLLCYASTCADERLYLSEILKSLHSIANFIPPDLVTIAQLLSTARLPVATV